MTRRAEFYVRSCLDSIVNNPDEFEENKLFYALQAAKMGIFPCPECSFYQCIC